MAKDGAKIEKFVAKKKINRYTKAECEAEITRLDNAHKNKDGVNMGDNSMYRADLQAKLATFA